MAGVPTIFQTVTIAPLNGVQVYTVFLGSEWSIDQFSGENVEVPELNRSLALLQNDLNSLLLPRFLSSETTTKVLQDYMPSGIQIAQGAFVGTYNVSAFEPGSAIDDELIRSILEELVSGIDPSLRVRDNLYIVYPPPGTDVIRGDARSCVQFCSYHSHIDMEIPVFYAVVPFPSCGGCLRQNSVRAALSAQTTHEIFNAVTDPVYGQGWIDLSRREIADLCTPRTRDLDGDSGFKVRMVWSPADNRCI